MTTENPDGADGRIEETGRDGAARHTGRLDDAVRTIKDVADKLAERIRLPSAGVKKQGSAARQRTPSPR